MEENKYGLILDNLSDVVWITGLSGEPSYISPSIKSFLGIDPEEFLAMPADEIFTQDSRKDFLLLLAFYEDVRTTLSGVGNPEAHRRALELEFLDKRGEVKVGEARASLHYGREGKVLGMLLLIRDITDRKRFEEKTVEMLNREKELSKFKTQVISTISHEFRTPISIIYSNLQLLKKFSYKIEEGIQKDAFELTTIAIQSLSKTLDNLTLLNQSNKGVLSYNPVEFDLLEECKRIASEISSINHNNGRIITHFDFPPGLVVMDKTLLNHVLSNLLVNALKFSSDETRVEFSLEDKNGSLARFTIIDRGIGIPEEDLDLVFESFYRGTNARGTKGTGLGLSIVKRCIELQNGTIEIHSKLDKGTEVNVILPYERKQ
jgi:PAS domain S-box-containing protein